MNTKAISKKNGHKLNDFSTEAIGDDHLFTSIETPMKANAFEMSNEEKKNRISILFSEIMDVLGLDLTDDSLSGTPDRVAKMYVEEIFSGLDPQNNNTTKCWWKRISLSIPTVSITLCLSLEKHI